MTNKSLKGTILSIYPIMVIRIIVSSLFTVYISRVYSDLNFSHYKILQSTLIVSSSILNVGLNIIAVRLISETSNKNKINRLLKNVLGFKTIVYIVVFCLNDFLRLTELPLLLIFLFNANCFICDVYFNSNGQPKIGIYLRILYYILLFITTNFAIAYASVDLETIILIQYGCEFLLLLTALSLIALTNYNSEKDSKIEKFTINKNLVIYSFVNYFSAIVLGPIAKNIEQLIYGNGLNAVQFKIMALSIAISNVVIATSPGSIFRSFALKFLLNGRAINEAELCKKISLTNFIYQYFSTLTLILLLPSTFEFLKLEANDANYMIFKITFINCLIFAMSTPYAPFFAKANDYLSITISSVLNICYLVVLYLVRDRVNFLELTIIGLFLAVLVMLINFSYYSFRRGRSIFKTEFIKILGYMLFFI